MTNAFEEFLGQRKIFLTPDMAYMYREFRPYEAALRGEEKHFKILSDLLELNCKRIIEVGVGTFADGFAKYSANAELFVGVDIDRETITHLRRWAKKNGRREEFLVGDGLKLPFKNKSFDRVIFNNFLGDFEKSITEAHRVLKDEGRIYLSFVMPIDYFSQYHKKFQQCISAFWKLRNFKVLDLFMPTLELPALAIVGGKPIRVGTDIYCVTSAAKS